jgi:flagellar assembly protein FliH
MTSLFEPTPSVKDGASTPPDLVTDLVSKVRRNISLLEFAAVDAAPSGETQQPAAVDPETERNRSSEEDRVRQVAAMIDAARSEAAAQARRELGAQMEAALAEQRARVDRVCAEFSRDRQRYFAVAEGQVVKLALAVARKVLASEVATNPMHLAAAVKVALLKVQDGSVTVLRVAPAEARPWSELLVASGNAAVDLVEDESLEPGACRLETGIGRIEFSVGVQMQEIERAFSELTPKVTGQSSQGDRA